MRKKILVLVALALAVPLCAWADSVSQCTAGEIYAIENATCTIGDKTFQFGMVTVTPFGNTIIVGPTTAFYFTPDDSNPNSPGFTISPTSGGSFGTPPPTTVESGFEYSLPYTVTTSGSDIIGTTVFATDASASANSGGSAEATVANTLSPGSFLCVDTAEAGVNTSGPLSFGSTNDKLILGCGGVTTTPGTATLTLLETNGMASLQSGSFFIDEATGSEIGPGGGSDVPEPTTLLLVGVGLLALAATRRKSHAFSD